MYYVIKSLSVSEEYVILDGVEHSLRRNVLASDLQLIDSSAISLEISSDGGILLPEFINCEGIPLLSNKLKRLFDDLGIDYVFWKKTEIKSDLLGIYETYWILIPPRIDCIDFQNSELIADFDVNNVTYLPIYNVKKLSIDPERVGRFEVFKILGINDNNIFISEKLKIILESHQIDGIGFFQLNGR